MQNQKLSGFFMPIDQLENTPPALVAFTFLGEKINISIIGNAITVYFKHRDAQKAVVTAQIYLYYAHFFSLSNSGVYFDDLEHDKYHFDSFDRELPHMHKQYDQPLNASNLEIIFSAYVEEKAISEHEKNELMRTYLQAPRLSQIEVDERFARSHLEELKTAVVKYQAAHPNCEREFTTHATAIIESFEKIISEKDNLVLAQKYLKTITEAINNPAPNHIKRLKTYGEQASTMSSLHWKALGATMLLLSTVLVIFVAAYSTAGLLTLATTALISCGIFNQGRRLINQPYLRRDNVSAEMIALSKTLTPS